MISRRELINREGGKSSQYIESINNLRKTGSIAGIRANESSAKNQPSVVIDPTYRPSLNKLRLASPKLSRPLSPKLASPRHKVSPKDRSKDSVTSTNSSSSGSRHSRTSVGESISVKKAINYIILAIAIIVAIYRWFVNADYFGSMNVRGNGVFGNNILFIDTLGGKVGIGTNQPTRALNVAGDLDITGGMLMLNGMPVLSIIPSESTISDKYALGDFIIHSNLKTVGTLDSLTVSGDVSLNSDVYLSNIEEGTGSYLCITAEGKVVRSNSLSAGSLNVSGGAEIDGTVKFTSITEGNGTILVIDDEGVIYKASSSIRYKQNVEPLDSTIDTKEMVSRIEPRTFEYKSNPGKKIYGFIAEELDQISKELVVYDKTGRPDGVEHIQIIPLLLSEVKRLSRELEELKWDN